MWQMFDDMLECDECGSPLGPPPKFMIPPPPRPPALADFGFSNCNEEEMALRAQQAWDSDICEAIPILDASLYSSPSLQTSAMIAVFSLLLVLVVLISSLFVWKNKRKVQNLLPCKTPTRGPHINGGLQLGTSHTVTYEEPDAHLGHHRPLVMRHHHNVEMMHGKSIHYPSGYPMTRSPPFLVSSSPGPDPYRSNDNVYEELGPSRESDGESDPPMHSDDDFAEDELSLPGERSFNKNNGSETTPTLPTTPGSNLYHERPSGSVATNSSNTANGPERISVLSSSSSTQDASTATVMSTNSSHNNNSNNNTINNNNNITNNNNINNNNNSSVNGSSLSGRSGGSIFSGMLRHTTGRNKNNSRTRAEPRANEMNTPISTADTTDFVPVQQIYDNRSNLMTLAYMPTQHQNHTKSAHLHQPYHQGQLHNINLNNNGPNAHTAAPLPFYNSLDNEVDRRNRINTQMNKQQIPAVATIFRERIHYPGSGRYPQPYYAANSANNMLTSSMRARTNPRSIDRRNRITAPLDPLEPSYGYAEPVFQHQVNNYHYDTCGSTALQQRLPPYPAYIIPEYASGPSVAVSGASYRGSNLSVPLHHAQQYPNPTQLYARGDSSFGSDSGYSHHTPASSIGRHDYEPTLHVTASSNSNNTHTPKTPSKLSAAFNFGWNRRKNATPNTMPPANLNVTHTSNRTEATSPNNNSANSTVAATPEINAPVATVAGVNNSSNASAGTTSLNNNAKA